MAFVPGFLATLTLDTNDITLFVTDVNIDETRTALDNLHHWNEESIHHAIEKLCEINNVGMGKIAQPLRVAITGATISPGIADSLVLLGKEKTLKRINDTLSFLRKQEA